MWVYTRSSRCRKFDGGTDRGRHLLVFIVDMVMSRWWHLNDQLWLLIHTLDHLQASRWRDIMVVMGTRGDHGNYVFPLVIIHFTGVFKRQFVFASFEFGRRRLCVDGKLKVLPVFQTVLMMLQRLLAFFNYYLLLAEFRCWRKLKDLLFQNIDDETFKNKGFTLTFKLSHSFK